MFRAGSILHGLVTFRAEQTNKYAIILEKTDDVIILSSFLTSQPRSGSQNPVHGGNPNKENPQSYVFKGGVEVGTTPKEKPFKFPKDTTIVPDYGILQLPLSDFRSQFENLEKKCQLFEYEYLEVIYVLYKHSKTPKEIKKRFEVIIERILQEQSESKK